ncbi:MAG TPA: hypothetical protein ENI23_16035 [bacterium]|nr:hypothetical protein [bacterium]
MTKVEEDRRNKARVEWFWKAIVLTGFLAFCFGAVGIHILIATSVLEPWQVTRLMIKLGGPLIKSFFSLFFLWLGWFFAKKKSMEKHKANWGELSFSQMMGTLIAEKFVALAAISISIAFAISVVPEVLQLSNIMGSK